MSARGKADRAGPALSGGAPIADAIAEVEPSLAGDGGQERKTVRSTGYKAFVSYSHTVDGALAPVLQQALHRFAKPWYRLRAIRVFRDEATLSANPQLWSSIEEALNNSEFFILLASPPAARSRWVQREVEHWCSKGRAGNLLIALTEGEIVWDEAAGDFDWERTTALPASLRGVLGEEPRHIDFRWAREMDGLSLQTLRFRDAVAELAAPLHGRPKDELVGEDVRQHRRTVRMARTAVALLTALTVAAVASSFVAVNQRDSARRQARIAGSRQLAAQALAHQAVRLDRSVLLSLEGLEREDTPEARGALLDSLQATPQLVRMFHVSEGLYTVAASPDGTTLAAGGTTGSIGLWDLQTGRGLGEPLHGHTARIESLTFSPDGRTLASASGDHSIRLWDVATRRPDGPPLVGHDAGVEDVAFSPDGQTLASAGDDHKIVLWDVAARRPSGPPLLGHGAEVRSVAFSIDGRHLVSGSFDGTAAIWDVALGRRVSGPEMRHDSPLASIAVSPDGKTFASASTDRVVRLWDLTSGQAIGEPLTVEEGTPAVAFNFDGSALAATTYRGKITLWGVHDRRKLGELEGGHEGKVYDVGFGRASTTTLVSAADDGTIAVWDTARTLRLGARLSGDHAWVRSVAFSPDSRLVATAMANGTIAVWDVARRERVGAPLAGHDGMVNSVEFSSDGLRLASGGTDSTVVLWDVRNGQRMGDPLRSHAGAVTAVAFSPDGEILASAGEDDTIVLWDPDSGQRLGDPLSAGTGGVADLAFRPDGEVLAAAGMDGTVALWDPESRQRRGHRLDAHSDGATSVAFSPDGRTLASAGADRKVLLADSDTAEERHTIVTGHASAVTTIAFSADSRMLATGSGDHSIALWDVDSRRRLGDPLGGHEDGLVSAVAFSPDGNTFASGSFDYTAIVSDVSPQAWKRQACALANRNLTPAEWQQFVGSQWEYNPTCGGPSDG